MNAKLYLTLNASSADEAQKILTTICQGLLLSGTIRDFRFEIETADGVVTERCLLSEGKVIA